MSAPSYSRKSTGSQPSPTPSTSAARPRDRRAAYKKFSPTAPEIHLGLGSLHRGFTFPQAQLALLNDHEIFSRQKRRYRYRRFRTAKSIANYGALQRGDFVVHIDHGIGRYSGIRRLRIGGREHDCLVVAYQDQDRVFVPVEQLDRLRKYSSAEGEVPLLNKLGSAAWEKLKERTREEIFKMASELVHLYAERKARPGFVFSADGPLHRELEAAFPFQETPDQLRTMEEVKKDMETPHPMDRLVCGDVGYGKTEVAVRAAFKAICDHKQAAVLVPTTILAEQHYQTLLGTHGAHPSARRGAQPLPLPQGTAADPPRRQKRPSRCAHRHSSHPLQRHPLPRLRAFGRR